MNESVISPWFVYLLFNINSFITITILPCVFSGIAILILLIGRGISKADSLVGCTSMKESGEKWYPRWTNAWKKYSKYLIPIFIGCLFMSIFTPNKNTIIAIYAANSITWGKIEKTMTITKDIKDVLKKDVIDIISSISKNEEQSNIKKKE